MKKLDIIYKLRIIFWLLIILIWGIYLYQYISEDIEESGKNKIILNNERKDETFIKKEKKNDVSYQIPETVVITAESEKPLDIKEKNKTRILINSTNVFLPEEHYKEEKIEENEKVDLSNKSNFKIPEGFRFKETRHFYLYVENPIDINEIEKKVELLHGEIMLDLIAFSPWTRDSKVHIYLALTPQKYQELSNRPPWSGGAANLREKKIYLYKSFEWFGILAHELTHIYFDSFFGDYDKSPLWLSEGMAVYIQVTRADAQPNWLKENIEYLKNGSGYRLDDLVKIKSLEDADDKTVKLWYAQSYSIVKFLLKIQNGDNFYQFCKNIKEGNSISSSLFRAYGKPYISLKALESVWRMDLKKSN